MESVLKPAWIGNDGIAVLDDASVSVLRERAREEAAAIGMDAVRTGALANIVSELAHNQLAHARRGEVAIRRVEREGVLGIEIVAADEGGGIADPTHALAGVGKPQGSLGVGLAAVLELADEIDIDTRIGEGTAIWARKLASPMPKRRQVGIFGRPFPGERVSGDHAAFFRNNDALLLAIADGLGHGPLAREASDAAMDEVRANMTLPPAEIITRAHAALAPTRGVVMAIARMGESHVETTCVGNIGSHYYMHPSARRTIGPSGVVGSPPALRPSVESYALGPRDMVVLFSDGINTRADIENDMDLRLRAHPLVVAHQLAVRFGRDNDDVLVIAVR